MLIIIFYFLVRVVQVLGREAALNLYTETKELESKGGMMTLVSTCEY